MNFYIKTLTLTALLVLSFIIEANPSEPKGNDKVDAKCFVELLGGGETITFWNISSNKLSGLSKSVVGRKVMVANSKQKVEIFKSFECVLLKDDFTSSNAKIVDSVTAR